MEHAPTKGADKGLGIQIPTSSPGVSPASPVPSKLARGSLCSTNSTGSDHSAVPTLNFSTLSLGSDSVAQTPVDETLDVFFGVSSKVDVEAQRRAVLESLFGPPPYT